MRDELRESLAFLPCPSQPWIWITKPSESRVNKFISGPSVSAGALSVKGPAKNELRRTVILTSHPSKPMVNEAGLTDPSPGNDRNDIYLLICPCIIQKSEILLSTKNIASGNG